MSGAFAAVEPARPPAPRALVVLLLLYALMSLVHFAHNAEYLGVYPNLPPWLTRTDVYLAWGALTLLGLGGYWVYRRASLLGGLGLLMLYALLGFDGLLHYQRAPFAAHTAMMNFSIWGEVVAAAVLLGFLATLLRRAAPLRPN
jgi:uncharacterized membrane protein